MSCPSANDCVAVGINENAETSGGGALIQSWTGKTWTSVAPKAPKGALSTDLLGDSCATAKSCVAVGSYDTPAGSAALAEAWNGASWTMARPPEPKGSVTGELLKVSCPSATDCLAVGLSGSNTAESALADRWNGKSWTRTPVQPPASAKHDADLTGVSCTSAGNCVAVGVGTARAGGGVTSFAEFWNGRAWSAGTISWPHGVSHPYLVAVSCGSARSCVAVGSVDANFNDGGHTGKAAATAWNGKTWTAATVAAPGKGKASLFNEVSCPAAACRAVGQLGPYNSDEGSALAGFWNGRGWSLRTTP